MNIIQRFIEWKDTRRLSRLEADLSIINNRTATYNPALVKVVNIGYNPELEFTRRVTEYYTWFVGNARMLNRFYKTVPEISENLSYFWKEAPANYRKVHSGLPSLIARKMAIVLFGGGFENNVEVYDESGNVNEKLSAELKDELEELKENVNLGDRLAEGATAESWGGHVFYKMSFDNSLSSYPILEVVDVRNARAIKERGITTAIEFCNYYEKGTTTYIHKEIYSTDENGFASIENQLYEKGVANNREVPLTTLPQTTNLSPVVVFEGLKGMLAFEKHNKLPNAEFYDSGYGESDFAGACGAFDALDETLSEIFKEIRENKTIRYIPQSMLASLEQADADSFNAYSNFVTNYQKINDIANEQARHEINITQISDKTLDHVEKWKVAMTVAVNKAGLSPLALGVTGLEAVNAGMESQRERNKATLETRAIKIKSWQSFLEKMLKQLIAFNAYLIRTAIENEDGTIGKIKDGETVAPEDKNLYMINVKFGDYIVESEKDLISVWGSAKTQRVASTEQAVRKINKDWSETQILDETNKILYESGMDADTPSTLPQLTGIEEVL